MIPIPACVVATAPVDGRVAHLVDDGTQVEAGDEVGRIESAAGAWTISAPRAGRVEGSLVSGRQPVVAGQGVLWLARA